MSTLKTWESFLLHSLASRLDPETFSSYLDILSSKYPLPPTIVSELILRPSAYNTASLDPRIPRYIQALLNRSIATVPSILRALHKFSSYGNINKEHRNSVNALGLPSTGDKQNGDNKEDVGHQRWSNSFASEESILYRLAKHITTGHAPQGRQETIELILISIKWMETVIAAQRAGQEMLPHAQEMNSQTIALATLMVAIVDNTQVIAVLSKGKPPKGVVKDLSRVLEDFVSVLLQISPQSAAKLDLFRTQTILPMETVEKKDKEVTASGEIDALLDEGLGIDSIVIQDLPILNSRAGLYIYINSLLVGRPLIDDNVIFAYLNNRYQGDAQAIIIDLILASFDVLANAMLRNKKSQDTTISRSFLINKVPLLLASLAPSLFPPFTAEYCITEALNQVDTNVFPTLANMFDDNPNSNVEFSDSVRQDFCFACSLHELIAESHIGTLLGEVPMQSLPAGGRFVKGDLVQQFLEDNEKASSMVDELDKTDGNVGAISQALTEVIGRLCASKETMSLERLCMRIFRKPEVLDVMLLFDKPITILQPLCDLLDNWRYDEDQGEYQPVYQEFGAILLLVLAFTSRYNLSTFDLGVRTRDSFVAKFLSQGHLSRSVDELSTHEQTNLTGWIRGLFDNESGGLGDELMSSCPPQDFYLLIPTLFQHVVLACSTRNLSDESLKGGLEYLVDIFLLPALIPAISWLASHLWESRGDANAVMQILAALIISPSSSSPDATAMLSTCIKATAKDLRHSLNWLQRAEPNRQDIGPLLRALERVLEPPEIWERRGGSDHVELEAWAATPAGGLSAAIKQTLMNLVQWASSPGLNVHPTNYTQRQILVGVKILGAKRLLGIILEEVKVQTEAGNGSLIYDIACALICAPDAASWDTGDNLAQPLQRRVNLREALKYEVEIAPKLHKSTEDGARIQAETLVRLYRKVEAQLLMPQQPDLLPQDPLVTHLDDAIMAGDVGMGVPVDPLGDPTGVGLGLDPLSGVVMTDDDIMSGLMNEPGSFFGGDDMGDGMGF